MLCWGNSKDGQLGIGMERNPVFEPRNCHLFNGRGLKEIACGGQHTLILLHDGSVYTCGSNSCGQLGHDKAGTSPELVGALDTQKITMVSCGRAHSMAVNEQGQVFAWGAGEGGQLGLGAAEIAVRIPRLVKRLCDHSISQVMCGNQHCIALSRGVEDTMFLERCRAVIFETLGSVHFTSQLCPHLDGTIGAK